MVFFKSVAAATAALSLISHSSATYNSASPANLAMYWGQGPNQDDLQTFCQSSSVDIIPIGFINNFVAQANGWVGNNHGNKCWGEGYGYYKAPGWPTAADYVPSKDLVFQQCGNVRQAIPICQGLNKKMILSLGGEWNTLTGATYQLTGAKEGIALAEFLWGAYGTYDANSDYIKNGGVRPLDGGFWGLDGTRLEVDGFDFDIEHPPTDNGAGYIACINRLRELFATKGQKGKEYLITGAPQCKFPDASLGKVIEAVKFDALFIQFYNTPECAAAGTGFNFKQWSTGITGPSKDAKLYIGLPGSPEAAIAGNYIEATAAKTLIDKNINDPKFGGVMIWEATYAKNNTKNGRTYNEVIKEDCLNPHAPTSTSSSYIASSTTTSRSSSSTSSSYIASSTTSSSTTSSSTTSSSTTSSSTTSSSTTSSSSSSSSTSSSYIASSTTSSSTTSSSSSSSSTSSSYIASSTTSSSSSSSSTSSSYIASSTSSSSTSSSYIASSTTSSSSSSSTSSTLSPTSSSSSSSTSSSSSSYIASSTTTSGSSSSASSLSSSTTTIYTPSSTSVSSSSSSTSETSTGGPSTTSKSSTSISETSTSESTPYPTFTTTSGSSVPTSPYPTSSGDGVPTSSSSSCSSSSSTTEYTTSTVYTTRVETVTSCAPTVTNCPSGPHVTTVTIPLYTTVCPVTKTHTPSPSGPATSPSAPSAPHTTQYTTSTIYTTKVHTITACPPSEIHCPVGSVTTETISLTTTVYPVIPTFKPTISIPSYPSSTPEGGVPNVPNYVPSNSYSTSTRKQTLTLYTTIKAVKPTATIVPSIVTVQPTPKYPAGPVKSYTPVGSGTGLPPSYPVTTSVAGGVKPYPSAVPSQIQQGAGSRIGVSSIMIALVMGVVAFMA